MSSARGFLHRSTPSSFLNTRSAYQLRIYGLEYTALGLHRCIGHLAEHAPDHPVCPSDCGCSSKLRPIPPFLDTYPPSSADGNTAAAGPTSAITCCAQSTPQPHLRQSQRGIVVAVWTVSVTTRTAVYGPYARFWSGHADLSHRPGSDLSRRRHHQQQGERSADKKVKKSFHHFS